MESLKETKTVLIVDHDSELASILGSYLAAQNCRALFTTRVREALRKVANQKFSHIFIDLDLKPETANLLFLELTTPSGLNFQTPVTVMSQDLEASIPMTHVKRVQSILPKPFTLQEFASQLAIAEKKKSQSKTA